MSGCKMYPPVLPEDIRQDPKKRAEVAVYDALASQLKDPEFHVFYSKEWLNKAFRSVNQEDGECDFVIAHPDLGILFVEVKGGAVRKEGDTGKWFSGQYKIKNPIYQAKTSKHFFREAMNQLWPEMPFLKLVHCVILPDSSPRTSYFGEGLPTEIFGFMEDMRNLARKIYSFYEFEAAGDHRISGSLGKYGIEVLKKMFAKDLDFSPRLVDRLNRDSFIIEELTDNQQSKIQIAENLDRVLFTGPAGSGKTMLAIRKAISEARENPEELLLFVCYNSPLAKFLRNQIEEVPENLEIRTFHSLCRMLSIESQLISQAEIDADPEKFFSTATDCALDAITALGPIFKSVYIDEGQDFEEEWWDVLQLCIKDNQRNNFWVFLDDNQNIRGTSTPDITGLVGPLRLFEVLRTTKSIGETSSLFYKGDELALIGPHGEPVEFVEAEDELRAASILVRKYVTYEGIKPKDIAVITIQAVKNTPFSTTDQLGGLNCYSSEDLGEGVVLDSCWRFKGLEAEVVILCGFPVSPPSQEVLYVGTSRAKTHLAVVGNRGVFDYLNLATE